MRPLAALRTDVTILVVDTVRVWWRLLPQILGVYLLGWLGSELALKLAAIAGDTSAWLALAIFSTVFLSQLTAIVVILQLAGRELGSGSSSRPRSARPMTATPPSVTC